MNHFIQQHNLKLIVNVIFYVVFFTFCTKKKITSFSSVLCFQNVVMERCNICCCEVPLHRIEEHVNLCSNRCV